VTEPFVPVLASVPANRANELLALLGSMGIEAEYRPEQGGAIVVRPLDEAGARRVLAEAAPEREERERDVRPREPALVWSRRGLGALVAIAAACVAVFWSTHLRGLPSRERLVEHGAISWSRVESGETWRLLAAIFVHFDGAHLLANLLTLALVGPPLAHLLGSVRFLVVFLTSGFVGNLVSHVLNPSVGLKAGASGAVAGVLGALGGLALRRDRPTRFRRWQVLGALGAVYAILVGAGPGRDNLAHAAGLLGGLVAGLLLGRFLLVPQETATEGTDERGAPRSNSSRPGSADPAGIDR